MTTLHLANPPTPWFVADPQADFALQSSDGESFLVRRILLEAGSDVFDGMFAGELNQPDKKDERTSLPLIKLDETAEDLDLLLRSVIKGQQLPNVAVLPFDKVLRCVPSISPHSQGCWWYKADTHRRLLQLADKYEFPNVKHFVGHPLFELAPSKPVEVLRVALKYRMVELARHAISHYGHNTISSLGSDVLGDLPIDALVRLIVIQEKKGYGTEQWRLYAKEFVSYV